MTRRRTRRPSPLFRLPMPRGTPDVLARRWRRTILAVIVVLAGLILADHLRPRESSPSPAAATASPDYVRYNNQTFRATRAVDGDTIHIDLPDGRKSETVIRLWGVDTPEVHGVETPMYFGPEASAFAHSAVDGQLVRLELVDGQTRDRYGRLLAYVYLPDGAMLNREIVEQGYAYADTRFAHPFKAEFARLERQARQERRGLWANVQPSQMPRWRQNSRAGG